MQGYLVSNCSGLKPEAVSVSDRSGKFYLVAGDPGGGFRSRGMARAEELRESILSPASKVVQGYQPIMPTFQGQISEEEVVQLIKYIRDLPPAAAPGAPVAAPAGGQP